MTHADLIQSELQSTIRDGRAILVAGPGVSIAASCDPSSGKPHPQASWVGLLKSGLEWLRDHKHISETKAAAHLTLLTDEPGTYSLITAAQHVTRLMGSAESVHFSKCFKETVGEISVHNTDSLKALEFFNSTGTCWQHSPARSHPTSSRAHAGRDSAHPHI